MIPVILDYAHVFVWYIGVHSSVDSLSERASVASGSSKSSEVSLFILSIECCIYFPTVPGLGLVPCLVLVWSCSGLGLVPGLVLVLVWSWSGLG